MAGKLVMLGPQRWNPTLNTVVAEHGVEGRLALVTAGWEEREDDDAELVAHLDGRAVNLNVWGRLEDVFQKDPELLEAMRARHDRLRQLQAVYRDRLDHALEAARQMLSMSGDALLLDPEREAAIDDVRRLDAHHLRRVRALHAEFQERWRPGERAAVAQQRAEVRGLLEGCAGLCIAGGHVAVLLNRMRALDVLDGLGERPIFAWSAGAMVLGERIVLFHDSPPQGAGNAEVLETGLRACSGIVPLPHAARRLRLDDPMRVGLFARRFGPDLCVALEEGVRVEWDGARWRARVATRHLTPDGSLADVEAA